MTRKADINRRRFITRIVGGISALSLTGCNRLSQSEWFPRVLSSVEGLNNRLHHAIISRNTLAREYTEADLSPHFPTHGASNPNNSSYQALAQNEFADWRLKVGGLVRRPSSFSLTQLRELPSRTQITRHDCVEGWSAIAKWKGAKLSELLARVWPLSSARYVVFYCADPMDTTGQKYYESIDFNDAYHPQTILAYEWNDQTLPVGYGAPIRLRLERQLGYKMAKYVMRIELVDSLAHIAGGNGGYWEDQGYEWYAGI
jgi:DMSO/TMAO reductase YedYZ molybdopterin-dependent catalytic subunit